ncbi:electron transport complex subunit RsxC [Thermoproteota archaeon]
MKTFYGGIHPHEYKELTEDKAIETLPLPDTVFIALDQHFGRPAKAHVKAGDTVSEGDLIAEADGFISAPIHSPVTGKIKKIGKHPHVLGIMQETIIIDRDKEAAPRKWPRNECQLSDIDKESFISILKDKGVVGLGGAGFPTYVKFMTKETQKLEALVINACECEPYITVDYRAMLEETNLFMEGLRIIQKATGVPRIIIGIEDNKPDAIKLMEKESKKLKGVSVEALKTKYPQGGEKMLIKAVLNKEVPKGGLPIDVGAVVVNVNTVIAITQAVFYDKPILEKIITVSGKGIPTPKNVKAKLGTQFSALLAFCGGAKDAMRRLIVGGPMMGFAQPNDQAAVLKTTTGLLALTDEEIGETAIEPCLKCGSCVRYCPMFLIPSDIAKYVEYNRIDLALRAGLMDCIECGCCGYVCTSHRPLVQLIKLGKIKKRELDNKKKRQQEK